MRLVQEVRVAMRDAPLDTAGVPPQRGGAVDENAREDERDAGDDEDTYARGDEAESTRLERAEQRTLRAMSRT